MYTESGKEEMTKNQLIKRIEAFDVEINIEMSGDNNEWWIALLKIRKEMLIKNNQDLLKGTSYDHG